VAEGVVVLLEAVEVEDREQQLLLRWRIGDRSRQVACEGTPVAETRQGIRSGLHAADPEQAFVLARQALDGLTSADRTEVEVGERKQQ
jgi:hypothetical protein